MELGPTNIVSSATDFTINLANGQPMFVDGPGGKFLPAPGSRIIDSAVDSLQERAGLDAVKASAGISPSPILAPDRDQVGLLRSDDPNVAPPSGQGSNVFKDRGARDRADFAGPVARLTNPEDNDANSRDRDPTISIVQLADGTITAFQVQLIDGFEANDPFPGVGVDDDTVVGELIVGLRRPGAAVTVFENGRLLREGFDYSFSYDAVSNVITLTPLAGEWKQDNVYEIALNNRDRFVVQVPSSQQIRDGQQIVVTDGNGGLVTLEFDSGYVLRMPVPLEINIPLAGGAPDGVIDGEIVIVNDGTNSVSFEFDRNSLVLPGSVAVPYDGLSSQQDVAQSLADAINQAVADGDLAGVEARVLSDGRVLIGAPAGATTRIIGSSVTQSAENLALLLPAAGDVAEGQTFTLSDGVTQLTFEFDTNNAVAAGNRFVRINGLTTVAEIVAEIAASINRSGMVADALALNGNLVSIGLPGNGSIVSNNSGLQIRGASRALADGQTITVTDSGTTVTFEFDYDGSVTAPRVAILVDLNDSADELAQKVAAAIGAQFPALADQQQFGAYEGGIVALCGTSSTQVSIPAGVPIDLSGEPGVATSSTIEFFGALQIAIPSNGAAGLADDQGLWITNNELTVRFEFDLGSDTDPPETDRFRLVPIAANADAATVATALSNAIAGSLLGLSPSVVNDRFVELGRLEDSAVVLDSGTQMSVNRANVADGERIRITRGGTSVVFEFDNLDVAPGVAPGNTPVRFRNNSTVEATAEALAAAVRSSILGIGATAIGDSVRLQDDPQTTVNASAAPTVRITGVPGGASPIKFVPSEEFSPEQIADSVVDAINNVPGTNLIGEDRGGGTLFIENALLVSGNVPAYFLEAIADEAGNELQPNRADNDTRFTILLPGTKLDFGDAPDPVGTEVGRYPTLFLNDGARHVVTPQGPRLGARVDGETDARRSALANGDDTDLEVVAGSPLSFVRDAQLGAVVFTAVEPAAIADGARLSLLRSGRTVTYEFDKDERFSEGIVPVSLIGAVTAEDVASRLAAAIDGSALGLPASADGVEVAVIDDDEDGVVFGDSINVTGAFVPGLSTAVTITVTGTGLVDFWIDFNADGDWEDPGEQVLNDHYFDSRRSTQTFQVAFPTTAPTPDGRITSFARVRVSTDGVVTPTSLAVDGEVEDYAIELVEGPPVASNDSYVTDEDVTLTVANPALGVLANDSSPYGAPLTVFDADRSTPEIDPASGPKFGTLTLNVDGTFTYKPNEDFNGFDSFTYLTYDGAIVSLVPGTVTITVNGVNDAPRPQDDKYQVPQGGLRTIGAPGVLINDIDPEGDPMTVRLGTPPTRGIVVLNPDGSFTYTHTQTDSLAQDSFTYFVSDGQLEAEATVVIEISDAIPPTHQNSPNPLDVNDDGFVSPIDALLIINHLNRGLTTNTDLLPPPPPYLDPSGDRRVDNFDALLVINFLNRRSRGGGEGEGEGANLVGDQALQLVDPRLGVGSAIVNGIELQSTQLPATFGSRTMGPIRWNSASVNHGRRLAEVLLELQDQAVTAASLAKMLPDDLSSLGSATDEALAELFDDEF
jgi:VCBS repeat-containing protein